MPNICDDNQAVRQPAKLEAGKRFVLKTASGAQGLEMLKREYSLSLRLQHPFIAAAIGWEERTPVGPAIRKILLERWGNSGEKT